jgi:lambda family phage tail tape measure protein
MLENNDLRARELGLLNAGNSVEQVRLQMQREQEESQLQLLEVEARRVLALNDATQEARAFAETVLIATERARTLATALEEARRFADMRAEIDTTIEGMQKENDLLETQLGYMEAGLEAAEARARAEVQLQIALARTLWLEGQITQEKFEQLAITLTDLAARGAELRASIQSLARPARGGGGGRDTDRLDAVQQLQQEIERTRTLLTLSAQEVALKQEMWRITDALGTDRAKYSDAFIAQLVREKLALEEQKSAQEEMLQQQQELFNKVQTSMENAFMSMVDGTKSAQDAFKDMARVIIAELFRVLVVQQLVGSFDRTTGEGSGLIGAIAGGLGFANGGAFSNGSVMPFANGAVLANMNRAPNVVPFARGGVVGSAALFPMTGGRTGLMGEAGPEAIMPLKRGKDGKLGVQAEGGSTVHIVQNFSVAANGDESVKRIVAQQVPAIAEATKAAVIDARKRGGQMRAAFR